MHKTRNYDKRVLVQRVCKAYTVNTNLFDLIRVTLWIFSVNLKLTHEWQYVALKFEHLPLHEP